MLTLDDIPDSQPNKKFYIGKVCQCNETDPWGYSCHGIRVHYSPGPPVPELGKVCNLPVAVYLDICRSCKSVFYSYFRHPYQISGKFAFPQKRYCWHCLEAGVSKKVHSVYSRVPKTPPAEELLNPYIKPPTLGESLDAALAKLGINT